MNDRRCPHCRLAFVLPREFNREIAGIVEAAFPREFKERHDEIAANERHKRETDKLNERLYGELYDKAIAGAMEEFRKAAVLDPVTKPEDNLALGAVNWCAGYTMPLILLNFAFVLVNFGDWSQMTKFVHWLGPVTAAVDIAAVSLLIVLRIIARNIEMPRPMIITTEGARQQPARATPIFVQPVLNTPDIDWMFAVPLQSNPTNTRPPAPPNEFVSPLGSTFVGPLRSPPRNPQANPPNGAPVRQNQPPPTIILE